MDNKELEARVRQLEKKLDSLMSLNQLPSDSTLKNVILMVNKITDSVKRKR